MNRNRLPGRGGHLQEVEHCGDLKAAGDDHLFQGDGFLFIQFLSHGLPQKFRFDGIADKAFLNGIPNPRFLALGQYPGGPFGYCWNVAPEGITDNTQFIQVGFFAIAQFPASGAQESKCIHVGLVIGPVVPEAQVFFILAPFAFESGPFADCLAKGIIVSSRSLFA